jgi:hypothetical protein
MRDLKEIPAIVGVTYADNAERSLRQLFEQGAGFFSFMFLRVFAADGGGRGVLRGAGDARRTGTRSRHAARARFSAP